MRRRHVNLDTLHLDNVREIIYDIDVESRSRLI